MLMGEPQPEPRRRSIRLRNYDYSQPGAYFITLCVEGKRCLLGEVLDAQVAKNSAGNMVEHWWLELPRKFPEVVLDKHVVMPNHFHGILIIEREAVLTPPAGVRVARCRSPGDRAVGKPRQPGYAPVLGDIMDWLKTMSTNGYIRGVKTFGWPRFSGRFWQRNYYEHVIRDENDFDQKRRYIADNPRRWDQDEENPANIT